MTNTVIEKTPTKRELFRLQTLVLVATANPKKKPSMSYDRFENYFKLDPNMVNTVQDALDVGVRMDDIRHDSEHGFILLGDAAEAIYDNRANQEKMEDEMEEQFGYRLK